MNKLHRCARCGTPYLPERVKNKRVLKLTYCGLLCQVADGYREEDVLAFARREAAREEAGVA